MKGPTKEKNDIKGPTKEKNEEKGAYEGQNERNRHSKNFLLYKYLKSA
jgi:hypothetical protein